MNGQIEQFRRAREQWEKFSITPESPRDAYGLGAMYSFDLTTEETALARLETADLIYRKAVNQGFEDAWLTEDQRESEEYRLCLAAAGAIMDNLGFRTAERKDV